MVTKEQAQKRRNESYVEKLRAIEPRIDELLIQGKGAYIGLIEIGVDYDSGLIQAIQQRYEQGGWKVQFQSDQRDGDSFCFT